MEEKFLMDICNPKQWKTIPKSELIEDGEFPVYGANGIIGRYNEYNHEKHTVLITCRGATCGNIHITVPNAYINGNAMALDNLNEIICKKEYLYYFLQYYDMSKIISGTAQPQITITGLKKVKVKLYSINKQEKIVNELNKINKLIKLKKRQLEELQKFIKSQFVEMFENNKFEKKNLGDVAIKITDGSHNPPKGVDERTEYVMLSSQNIIEDKINYNNARYLSRKDFERENKRTYLEKGDVLLTIVGTIGRTAVIDKEKNITLQRSVAVIKPIEKIKSEYLVASLKTDSVINQLNKRSKGVAQKGIYLNDLKKIFISVPPITLQNQFSEIVKQIDKQKFESMIQLDKEERKVLRNIITDTFGEIIILYEFLLKKYFEEGK